jgi:hypothetical protein
MNQTKHQNHVEMVSEVSKVSIPLLLWCSIGRHKAGMTSSSITVKQSRYRPGVAQRVPGS